MMTDSLETEGCLVVGRHQKKLLDCLQWKILEEKRRRKKMKKKMLMQNETAMEKMKNISMNLILGKVKLLEEKEQKEKEEKKKETEKTQKQERKSMKHG